MNGTIEHCPYFFLKIKSYATSFSKQIGKKIKAFVNGRHQFLFLINFFGV